MGAATAGEGTSPPGTPPPTQPKRSAMPWLLVALLLLASAVVGFIVYQQLQGTDQVKVPDVSGLTKQQAKTQLVGDGFTTKVENKKSSKVDAGNVITTDPAPNSSVDKGSKVTIIVSTGPKSVKLPDLHGVPLNQALQTISSLGLPTPSITPITSKLESNTVVRTDPKSGQVAPDTVVTLFVASGNVKVPNVVGRTCSDATATLQGSKLLANCTDTPSDTVPAGQVISQSPSASSQAPQGSTVQLSVSSGPAPVSVPDVTNTDFHTAKKTLKEAGLKAQQSKCLWPDPTVPDGTVVETDPPSGQSVDPGTTVTVFVADSTSTTPCP